MTRGASQERSDAPILVASRRSYLRRARQWSSRGLVCTSLLCASMLGPIACEPTAAEVPVTPIKVLSETPGRGEAAKAGDEVCIDYCLKLPTGQVVLEDKDFCFVLGAGAVIEAVDEGVHGMRPRGRRVIEVPPHKHWGRAGYGDGAIPPATDLQLQITLKRIQ